MSKVDSLPGQPFTPIVALHQALESDPSGVVMVVFEPDDTPCVMCSSMSVEKVAFAIALLNKHLFEILRGENEE